ncbi:SDR family oxidoreductase [bacterium]|nr:SDR family oxidoreductase [bacterium]
MKKILVTGHKGFIGSALMSVLRQCELFETIGVSRSDGMSLLNFESLEDLPDVDTIVHLAGSVGVMRSWSNPFDTYRNNIIPTLNILEYARIHKVSVIYMSSYVYGIPVCLPIDELHPINCRNPYACSKRQAEILCEAYSRDFRIPVTILRPFNIYGPGQTQESLIPRIIRQAKDKHSIEVKDLRPKRDYLYIDDLTDALLKVICSESEHMGVETYNLGFGKSYSVQDIIDMTLQMINEKILVHSSKEYRPNEIMDCYSDSQKFSEHFDWKPQTNLVEGITNLLKFERVGGRGENVEKC